MNDLENHMQKFEWKYSIKSAQFYKLVLAGKIEEAFELHEWLGLHKLWLDHHEEYLNLLTSLKSPSPLLNIAGPLGDAFFESESESLPAP